MVPYSTTMRLRIEVEVQVQEENRWQGLAILYQKLKLRLVVCSLHHNSNGSHEGALHALHAIANARKLKDTLSGWPVLRFLLRLRP